MYAIVEIAGHQYKVRQDQQVYVHRLEGNEGDSVSFDRILLTDDNGSVNVGAPVIEGIQVSAEIMEHLKADKVIIFKKKRRKGYRKKNGHRQLLSLIKVTGIGNVNGSAKKAEAKKAEPKKETAPKAEAKAAPKKETAPKTAATSQDDLTRITGVGPKFAEELKKVGYTSFEQISKLTKAEMADVAEKVGGVSTEQLEGFKDQAKTLYGYNKVLGKVGTATAKDKNDLTAITGIGPVTEGELNEVGVYTYEQISKLGAKEMEYLSGLTGVTKELIQSEEWVKQAKELLK